MKVKGITTIDSEINFGECEIHAVPERIKRLFPDQDWEKLHLEYGLYRVDFYERLKRNAKIVALILLYQVTK